MPVVSMAVSMLKFSGCCIVYLYKEWHLSASGLLLPCIVLYYDLRQLSCPGSLVLRLFFVGEKKTAWYNQ